MRLSIESVKSRLVEIDKERKLLLNLLNFYNSLPKNANNKQDIEQSGLFEDVQPKSMSDIVISHLTELVNIVERPVDNKELMSYLLKQGVGFNNSKSPERLLSAILSNELKKDNSRILRAGRGLYAVK